jgi:hypothetical protein
MVELIKVNAARAGVLQLVKSSGWKKKTRAALSLMSLKVGSKVISFNWLVN